MVCFVGCLWIPCLPTSSKRRSSHRSVPPSLEQLVCDRQEFPAAQNLTVQFRPLERVALRDFLKRTYGRLDILINNAGIIAHSDAPGLKVDMETVRVTLETNALGPFHLSQALAPLLQRSKRARIVNLSSGMGALSEMEGDYAAYRISKTALNAVTAILAAEVRGRAAVNAACPGWVRTDMGGGSAERDVRARILLSGSPWTRHRS